MALLTTIALLSTLETALAEVHPKFQNWYPYYGGVLDLLLEGTCQPVECNPTTNCSADLSAYLETKNDYDATSRCYNVYDCLSSGLLPNEASNFSNASVLLGLTPSLLAALAPTLGEITLLSTQRKLLALILALANPVISIPRYLTYTDPLQSLENAPTMFMEPLLTLKDWKSQIGSALQYTLGLAAVANVIHNSWQLGYQTVVSWKCNGTYLPFLWSILPTIINILAAVGWHLSSTNKRIRKSIYANDTTIREILATAFRNEIKMTSNASPLGLLDRRAQKQDYSDDKIPMFLNELAGFLAFLQVLFGTLVFSSLMFIATLDALAVIARYMASGLICRFIVTWELAAMRRIETENASSPPV